MIIKSGETVTIRAIVSPNSGLYGGSITWEPAVSGDPQADVIARAVNAHDALLAACRGALLHRQSGDLHPIDWSRITLAVKLAESK